MSDSNEILKVGISIGDMNGIGMEVIIKTFLDARMLDFCTPIIYGSSGIASYHLKSLDVSDFSFNIIKSEEDVNIKQVNLINIWQDEVTIDFGTSSDVAGKYAIKSLNAATEALASNKVDVLVTAPFNKHNVQSDTFQFAGHTEYLADYANVENPLMILCSEGLRVGLVTGHIPLKEVAATLDVETIFTRLTVFNRSLIQDFEIGRPKIAVLSLNPHAGDQGVIGDEEEKMIIPSINKAKEQNMLAFGPFSADGFFGSSEFANYDGVLAMYHDQGLIPFKALSFENGVNYTAGLPIVRTAPDHGTAYNIAGNNIASPASFRNAVLTACDVYKARKEYKQLSSNQLKTFKPNQSTED